VLSDFVAELSLQGQYLLIRRSVLSKINREAKRRKNTETGGVLLGCYRGHHIDVVGATVQQLQDRASKYAFHRKDATHQRLATKCWRRSNRVVTYVGEWHSHPEHVPSPSIIDLSSWKDAVARTRRTMVFAIVGWEAVWIGVGHYENGLANIVRCGQPMSSRA